MAMIILKGWGYDMNPLTLNAWMRANKQFTDSGGVADGMQYPFSQVGILLSKRQTANRISMVGAAHGTH